MYVSTIELCREANPIYSLHCSPHNPWTPGEARGTGDEDHSAQRGACQAAAPEAQGRVRPARHGANELSGGPQGARQAALVRLL